MKIIGASAMLSQVYNDQVGDDAILSAAPRFGKYMAIDYAMAAANDAFAKAGINACDVDLIISMSISPGYISDHTNIVGPRLCHPLQRELGADKAVVFDLHDACWTFALDTARCFLHEMNFRYALIIRADCVTGLDTRDAGGLAWDSGAGALLVERSNNDDWEVEFLRLDCVNMRARIELLDARLRFKGNYRAALYFSSGPQFSITLANAIESLVDSTGNSRIPFIEPWLLPASVTKINAPQLAPYAFPLSRSTPELGNQYDGLISFDPFRMQLGACKVNAL